MKWNNLNFIIILIASVTLTSCVETKTNSKTSSSDATTTQSTVLLPSETSDADYVDTSDLPDYYDLPVTSGGGVRAIIVHGTNSPNNNPPPDGIFWSSNRDSNMSAANREILVTDSKFEIRVQPISHSQITQDTVDSNGYICKYVPMKYTKLNIDICVRKQGESGCLYSHYFQDLDVSEWSLVKEFNVPANTNDPLIIDVNYVSWDGSCIQNGSPTSGDYSYTCPYDGVWSTQCVGFTMQVSVDGTKSLPGGRY